MLTQSNVPIDFLSLDAWEVAPKLIGWVISTTINAQTTSGIIVETEAYAGGEDPASHAYRGPRPRNMAMYLGGGHLYAYRSYGIHTCLNIVTGTTGKAQAVLIRALEPAVGLRYMKTRRGVNDPRKLANGPGRLTQALGITTAINGSAIGDCLSLTAPDEPNNAYSVQSGPRIGISAGKDLPWRFTLTNSLYLSHRSF